MPQHCCFQIRPPASLSEFESYYDLRFRLLREPWNQPRGSEKDEHEDCAFHLAAWDTGGSMVGVGRLHQASEGIGQIRFMAVDLRARSCGCGRAILSGLEARGREWRFTEIVLNAREAAIDFYLHSGYRVVGRAYVLFDSIPHYVMRKQL